MNTVQLIMAAIEAMPGVKSVSLDSPDSAYQIDVNGREWGSANDTVTDWVTGREEGGEFAGKAYKLMFQAKLGRACHDGSIVVRQFLPDKTTTGVPIVFGLVMKKGRLFTVPPETLADALPAEPGVRYRDFSEWLDKASTRPPAAAK